MPSSAYVKYRTSQCKRETYPVETFLAVGRTVDDFAAVFLAVPNEHLVLNLCLNRFAFLGDGPVFGAKNYVRHSHYGNFKQMVKFFSQVKLITRQRSTQHEARTGPSRTRGGKRGRRRSVTSFRTVLLLRGGLLSDSHSRISNILYILHVRCALGVIVYFLLGELCYLRETRILSTNFNLTRDKNNGRSRDKIAVLNLFVANSPTMTIR